MGFAAYIRKEGAKEDACVHFAKDFIRALNKDNPWLAEKYVNVLESETLLGVYRHLPNEIGFEDEVFLELIELWKGWIRYKHIGYKFKEPNKGYLYFYRIPNRNIFKIGKTSLHPEVRKFQVEKTERIKLDIYNWIKLNYYDLIETEVKNVFKKMQVQREFYEFKYVSNEFCMEIDEAIECYRRTDHKYELMKEFDY